MLDERWVLALMGECQMGAVGGWLRFLSSLSVSAVNGCMCGLCTLTTKHTQVCTQSIVSYCISTYGLALAVVAAAVVCCAVLRKDRASDNEPGAVLETCVGSLVSPQYR